MPHGSPPYTHVIVGARAKFTLNGQLMAWAFGVSVSEEMPQEAIEVLDRYEPAEYAVTAYRVTMNARVFRIPSESLRTLGLWPLASTGSDALRQNILNFPEMNAEVQDSGTGVVIAALKRVRPQSRNLDITPRGVVGENVSFTAVYMLEEGDSL